MNNLKFSTKIGLSFAMVILVTAAAMMFRATPFLVESRLGIPKAVMS